MISFTLFLSSDLWPELLYPVWDLCLSSKPFNTFRFVAWGKLYHPVLMSESSRRFKTFLQRVTIWVFIWQNRSTLQLFSFLLVQQDFSHKLKCFNIRVTAVWSLLMTYYKRTDTHLLFIFLLIEDVEDIYLSYTIKRLNVGELSVRWDGIYGSQPLQGLYQVYCKIKILLG